MKKVLLILFLSFCFFNETFAMKYTDVLIGMGSANLGRSMKPVSGKADSVFEGLGELAKQCNEFWRSDEHGHDAVEIFKKVSAINFYDYARFFSHTSHEESISNYETIALAYSNFLLKFGAQCQEKGDEERAKKCFLKSLEIDSQWGVVEGIPAFYTCGICLEEILSGCENCEKIERIVQNRSRDDDEKLCHGMNHFGRGCLRLGNYAKAKDLFLKVLAIDPDNFHACIGLGFIYGLEEDGEKLKVYLLKRLEINPDDSGAVRQLSRIADEEIEHKLLEIFVDKPKRLHFMFLMFASRALEREDKERARDYVLKAKEYASK